MGYDYIRHEWVALDGNAADLVWLKRCSAVGKTYRSLA